MSYAAANARSRARKWTYDEAEVRAFGAAMVSAEYITDASTLQEYYEQPHGWSKEHAWWNENGRTDNDKRWDDGADERFAT